jgi:hypothetical protein
MFENNMGFFSDSTKIDSTERAHCPLPGSELSPADQSLLTQQGGTLAFNGTEVIYR